MKSTKKLKSALFMGLLTIGSVSFAGLQSERLKAKLDYAKSYAQALKNLGRTSTKLLSQLEKNIAVTQDVFFRILVESIDLVEKLKAAGESEFAHQVSEFWAEKIDELNNDLIDLKSEMDSSDAEGAPVSAKIDVLRDYLTLLTTDVDEWKELHRTITEALEEINKQQEEKRRKAKEFLQEEKAALVRKEQEAASVAYIEQLQKEEEARAQEKRKQEEADAAEARRLAEQWGWI